MNKIQLTVSPRNSIGSQNAKRLRAQKQVPAVIYGPSDNRLLTIHEPDLSVLSRKIMGISAIIEILDGQKKTLALVKDVQRNPRTDAFIHVDFLEISENEEMAASLPVHIKGESFGVKNEGGVLELLHHTLRIRCLPRHLPPFIEVNISELRVGQSIHIKDLPKLDGILYLQHDDSVIVACAAPKVETATTEAATATTTVADATKTPEKSANAKTPPSK